MAQLGRTGARFGPPQDRQEPVAQQERAARQEPAAQQEPAARQEPVAAPVPPAPQDPGEGSGEGPDEGRDEGPDEDLVGVTGARFGGHSTRRTRRSRRQRAAERAIERATERPATAGGPGEPPAAPAPPGAADTAPLPVVGSAPVRPYVLTGGRTRVRAELRLETLVSVRPAPGAVPVATAEHAAVLRICARSRSVSEVAALTGVPLGVARVLIDDLVGERRLLVHGCTSAEDGPGLELMERVLSGLRGL